MKILVTGGAGFIGSHTSQRLVQAGHQVRVLDDFSTGKRINLKSVEDEIELLKIDIRDFAGLRQACKSIEVIIHLAAVSSVVKSIDDPLTTHEVNATGSLNVFHAARLENVRRVILASSASIYGNHPQLPKTENSPTQPLSPYAWQKLNGEFYGRFYSRLYGTEFIALRYFNVYGPRQDPSSPYSGVLSIFTQRASRGEPLVIYGDGNQTRDFIHVSDVAEINLRVVESDWPLPEVINVSTGKETRIIDAAWMIQNASGSTAGIAHDKPRQGDIRRSYASNKLLVKTFGYQPQVSIEEGLRDLMEEERY
jgi:UDP-glucose 4-epimerase